MTMDVAGCKAALIGLPIEDGAAVVRQKSRDFFWYSPILKRQLDDVTGDFVVSPRNQDEVVRLLATAYAHDVPVTVRGAGTGNYGQSMPLAGGCVLHTQHLRDIITIADDHMIVQPGAIIAELEAAAREKGRELRLFPSTTGQATIGGFIAGGSSGVGAIRWGGLRNPANIRRLRLVTMEAKPRVLDLVGADIAKASHAYGVNGVITEVEIPIDPSTDWVDVLIGLPGDVASATALATVLGEDAAILKRMLSVFEPSIGLEFFQRYRPLLVEGESLIASMVAPDSLAALETCLVGTGATIRYRSDRYDGDRRLPHLYEMAWNHTTLRAIRTDPGITYLQMMFPRDRCLADLGRVKARFGDELLLHLELTRFDGVVTPVGMPLIRYTTDDRLEEIIMILEGEMGLPVFNPHRATLEEGGMKKPDLTQLAFKREADPKGLMNPGKMIAWSNPDWQPEPGRTWLFTQ